MGDSAGAEIRGGVESQADRWWRWEVRAEWKGLEAAHGGNGEVDPKVAQAHERRRVSPPMGARGGRGGVSVALVCLYVCVEPVV